MGYKILFGEIERINKDGFDWVEFLLSIYKSELDLSYWVRESDENFLGLIIVEIFLERAENILLTFEPLLNLFASVSEPSSSLIFSKPKKVFYFFKNIFD